MRVTTGKRIAYFELVQGKRIERHIEKITPKPVSAFKVHGKSPDRRDALEKVTGRAKYADDILLSGLLHARILRPPAHDAVLKQLDTSGAEKLAGVRVLRDGDLVAVLHERPDIAERAKALIKAEYDRPPATVDDRSTFEHLLKNAPEAKIVGESGSLAEGERLCGRERRRRSPCGSKWRRYCGWLRRKCG